MKEPGWLLRLALHAVPSEWRLSVARDLIEDAARTGQTGARADIWCAAQALAIAGRFQARRLAAWRAAVNSPAKNVTLDVRLAWRSLRHRPWSAAAIVATLALGIGAATATYGVFNYALFRPVPGVQDPDRLVSMYFKPQPGSRQITAVPHTYVTAMRDHVAALSGLAAYARADLPLSTSPDELPSQVPVTRVTRGYFEVLGVRPAVGRLFADDEYEHPGPHIAVISEWLWRHKFGADRAVIGREIRINAQPFTVIGVADAYRGPKQVDDEDVWVPLAANAALGGSAGEVVDQWVIGRLRAGATVEQAEEQSSAVFDGVGRFVQGKMQFEPAVYAGLTDGIGQTRARLLAIFYTLMAGVAMLFLVGCANAANLILANNGRRMRDVALRSAIGASRSRIVREGLVESGMLAVLAAVAGFGVAETLTGLFRGTRLLSWWPSLDDLSLDWRVALFAAAAAGVTVILAGIGPSVLAARVDPQQALRETQGMTRRGGRLRASLVGLQLGLSLALIVSAVLLAQTVIRLEFVDLGMQPDHVVEFPLRPANRGYNNDRTMAVFTSVLGRLREAPQVQDASLTWSGPLDIVSTEHVRRPDEPAGEARVVVGMTVTADYFKTLGIPMLSGRSFTDAEVAHGISKVSGSVIVSTSLANALFGRTDVVGQMLADDFWGGQYEIVGVVPDSVSRDLRLGKQATVYSPLGTVRIGTYMVRSAAPLGEIATAIRRAVHDVDPTLPTPEVITVRQRIDELLVEEHLFAELGVIIAGLATSLAAFGVYAVVAFFVDERRRDFAVRTALGAPRSAAAALVLRRVLRMAATGFPAGALLYWAVSRVLTARLYGVGRFDPATLALATAGLLAMSLLAAWLPARRASRVDPISVLRAE